jgi:hypothetical protein
MSLLLRRENLEISLMDPRVDHALLGSRYSHSGYIRQVRIGRTTLLHMPREPFQVFQGCGCADEFEAPLGYDRAAVGQAFLTTGVGAVGKVRDYGYTNWDGHPVLEPAAHEVAVEPGRALFDQHCRLDDFAYRYRKSVELVDGQTFRIRHLLENAGPAELTTSWYSHIFLDRKRFADPVSLTAPAGSRAQPGNSLPERGASFLLPPVDDSNGEEGSCFHWQTKPGKNDTHAVDAGANRFSASSDYSPVSFMVYCNSRIVSPEPRIGLTLQQGQTAHWSTTYHFALG